MMRHLMREFTRKMPGPKIGMHSLCEPAQSKLHMDMQEPFYGRIRRKNAGEQMDPLDLTPALTPTERTPSVWTHCWGKKMQKSARAISTNRKINSIICHVFVGGYFNVDPTEEGEIDQQKIGITWNMIGNRAAWVSKFRQPHWVHSFTNEVKSIAQRL